MTTHPLFSLRGRTVVVTGAFSGLGKHFCSTLAHVGANVAMAGRRIELGQDCARSVQQSVAASGSDAKVRAFALDVTQRASVAACLNQVEEAFGQPTILVNNAGVASTTPALAMSDEDWSATVDVNLTGAWRVAQAFAQGLVAHGLPGSIINIGSILGLRVAQQVPAYAASKAGLLHLTRAFAVELARHTIRVNAIAPGYFETDINKEFFSDEAGQALVRRVPQRRLGQPAELDGPLLLLASDACSFMTGSVITVDGGHSINSL